MALFKGELTLNEILYQFPYKRLMELVQTRQDRLIEEEKSFKEAQEQMDRDQARQSIIIP